MAWHIAANILTPLDFNAALKYPTVIAIHPFGSCKEQSAGNVYGPALAKEGFVVLIYEASFQGESGSPHWIEGPNQRVEDVSHVIDYAATLPYVDADRIGVLGICGGGGYALNATLTESASRPGSASPESTLADCSVKASANTSHSRHLRRWRRTARPKRAAANSK